MDKQKYWFFGSKLNTVLLIILIILMFMALHFMYQDKPTYLPKFLQNSQDNKDYVKDNFQIEGNKEDLVSFSINPGQEVSGKMEVTGSIGGYYFEGSFPIVILDANKKSTSYGPGFANATSDWMASGPIPFKADFDFSVMPKGKYYIKLMQDDPSGGESGKPIRSVLVPIVVK